MAATGSWAAELRAKGLLAEPLATRLEELETRAHVPLGPELNALLYLGALLLLAGVGAAVKDRLNDLGPLTVLACLGAASAGCLAYCFGTGRPYAPERVDAPTVGFDYVLYLGCGLAGVFVSYLEWKWSLLGSWWDLYLLAAGASCVWLAYRFDNRLVLATGFLNLAGAIGARFRRWDVPEFGVRGAAVALGCALVAAGRAGARRGVKAHFEQAYLRFGLNLALLAVFYGASSFSKPDTWLLLVACGALAAWSVGERRFETFAYAVLYGYAGAMRGFLDVVHGEDATLWTLILSSGAVVVALLKARRWFSEER